MGGSVVVGLEADEELGVVDELSCQRTHTFSSLDWPLSSSRSESAMKTSERTPVGISHTKVSRLIILETAIATSVPSILPLSLVMRYSDVHSEGPSPIENFRMYFAYLLLFGCDAFDCPRLAPRERLAVSANLLGKHKVAKP